MYIYNRIEHNKAANAPKKATNKLVLAASSSSLVPILTSVWRTWAPWSRNHSHSAQAANSWQKKCAKECERQKALLQWNAPLAASVWQSSDNHKTLCLRQRACTEDTLREAVELNVFVEGKWSTDVYGCLRYILRDGANNLAANDLQEFLWNLTSPWSSSCI